MSCYVYSTITQWISLNRRTFNIKNVTYLIDPPFVSTLQIEGTQVNSTSWETIFPIIPTSHERDIKYEL